MRRKGRKHVGITLDREEYARLAGAVHALRRREFSYDGRRVVTLEHVIEAGVRSELDRLEEEEGGPFRRRWAAPTGRAKLLPVAPVRTNRGTGGDSPGEG